VGYFGLCLGNYKILLLKLTFLDDQ